MELLTRVKNPLNKENKIVAGNFLFLFFLKGIDFLIPLLTLPYLFRVIGRNGYGIKDLEWLQERIDSLS